MTTQSHCCECAHCLDTYEAVSLRLRLDFIGDPRYEGKNGTKSGSDLENLALAIDRLEAADQSRSRLRVLWDELEAIDGELRAYPVTACPVKTLCAEHTHDWQRVR